MRSVNRVISANVHDFNPVLIGYNPNASPAACYAERRTPNSVLGHLLRGFNTGGQNWCGAWGAMNCELNGMNGECACTIKSAYFQIFFETFEWAGHVHPAPHNDVSRVCENLSCRRHNPAGNFYVENVLVCAMSLDSSKRLYCTLTTPVNIFSAGAI